MKSIWQPFLEHAAYVVIDGGLASELERRGADLRDALWSAKLLLENLNLIRQVHYDYLAAGADVVISASYQASFEGFADRGLDHDQASHLMIRSVKLAQEARAAFWDEPAHRVSRVRPLVAASVGCYGAVLHDGSEYRGDYALGVDQLVDWHRPRMAVLARSGADLFACETIPCLAEAKALARLLPEFPDMPAWVSFSCQDELHVCHGETLAACVETVANLDNVHAVGINCTPPQFVEGLLHSLAGVTDKPIAVYPNQGESWDAARHAWVANQGENCDWQQLARAWNEAGAKLIGGCCRTTPATVEQIRVAR